MRLKILCSFLWIVSAVGILVGQEPPTDELEVNLTKRSLRKKVLKTKFSNPLAPTKAAFYSAVLPGLGQAYTGKYWKIPIVYGGLATGIGIAVWNQGKYDEIRDIYRNRLLGIYTDKFYDVETGEEIITTDYLANAQKRYKQQKELSILITVGLYVLNIIDANVTAHLLNYNVSEDLSLRPHYNYDNLGLGTEHQAHFGLQMSYRF